MWGLRSERAAMLLRQIVVDGIQQRSVDRTHVHHSQAIVNIAIQSHDHNHSQELIFVYLVFAIELSTASKLIIYFCVAL